jgi:asparagine synthase (glutamine-hydrolysing)
MSGFVALVQANGALPDPELMQSLTDSLRVRGPHGSAWKCFGGVGLGHALFRSDDLPAEQQPFTLDGQVWIVSDARVDARAPLAARLAIHSSRSLDTISDGELLLRAYQAWGESCVDALLGDFAFAIWDVAAKRLFCARDHMGVKPLYYATAGDSLIVSSAIECVRRHPFVGDTLDDLAIADLLLFGHNTEHASTIFRAIRRVPPAHTLTWWNNSIRTRPYWELPVDEPAYMRDEEYAERFRVLVRDAVSDRLRSRRASIFISGGLDSTTLAAFAAKALGAGHVRGFTFVFESLFDDPERTAAAAAARALGIETQFVAVDDAQGWPEPLTGIGPEPFVEQASGALARAYAAMAEYGRVAFYGEGPDNALAYEWQSYLAHLWRSRAWRRIASDGVKFAVTQRRVPFVGTIRTLFGADLRPGPAYVPLATVPRWISPAFSERVDLGGRLRSIAGDSHPIRPRGHASMLQPLWQDVFEGLAPSYTGAAIDVRHPYLDLRVLRFLLSVPVVPWCREKYLIRYAMKGVLPDAVLRRRKTPLQGEPDFERVRRYGMPPPSLTPRLEAFGDARLLEGRALTPAQVDAELRFVRLSHWLANLDRPPARPPGL